MIQVEKRNARAVSRIRGSQKPSNFLARNRRAVCGNTQREETGNRRAVCGNTQREEAGRRSRHGKPIPASRRQKEERGNETVVISKTYLDELLRVNGGPGVSGSGSHVVVDPGDVPGLLDSTQPQHISHAVASHKTVPSDGTPVGHPPNHTHREQELECNPSLSQHDQWLRDLSKQVEDQRRKRESEKLREKEPIIEDYNPWGRPGGGAPIRSESGNLLTDYRTRGRVAEEGGRRKPNDAVHRTPNLPPVPVAVADPSPALSTQGDTTTPRFARLKREAEKQRENDSITDDYNPWGRPGAGAPIRSESGNLLTDYRTRGRVAEEGGRRKPNDAVHHTPNLPPVPVAVADPSPALSTQGDTTTPRFARLKREAEKQRENDSITDDYNPWGRPGAGAPIRSESGNLLTDYRTRGRVAEVTGDGGRRRRRRRRQEDVHRTPNVNPPPAVYHTPNINPQPALTASRLPMPVADSSALSPQGDSTTPRFARGAGPYVDRYVLEQRDHQRRKDQEHMAFIREQIAAKERQKLEERLHREREEREEAEKLARERERLQREHQQEVERARRKEEEARQQQALLTQRIAEAEQSAKRAKVETRLTKVNPRHRRSPPPNTVHFTEREPHHHGSTVLRSRASQLHSPSMLQVNDPHSGQPYSQEPRKDLQNSKQTLSTARHRGGPNRVPDSSKVRSGVPSNLRQGSVKGGVKMPARETPSRIPVRQTTVRSQRDATRAAQPAGTNMKPRTEPTPQLVLSNTLRTVQSPPVPALTKKLNRRHYSTVTPDPSPTRLPSPPVPALAKKLGHHHHDMVTPGPSPMRAKSPPVLEHGAVSTDVGCDSQTYRSHSPPVPALAKQLRTLRTSSQLRLTHHQTPSHNSQPTHTTRLEEAHSMPINRPPSCTLTTTPLLPPLPTNTLTQTAQTAAVHPSNLSSQGTLPMATRRQHTILQQLEVLRQGIMSQRLNLDHRVTGILTRNTCIL